MQRQHSTTVKFTTLELQRIKAVKDGPIAVADWIKAVFLEHIEAKENESERSVDDYFKGGQK